MKPDIPGRFASDDIAERTAFAMFEPSLGQDIVISEKPSST
jgi:hypothetical protein